MTVFVNDRPHPLPVPPTLASLLCSLGFSGRRGFAVAVNGAVVARAVWPERTLLSGDRILLIQATQGG